MAHARRQIIDQMITNITGATAAGTNVGPARLYALDPASLPAIHVTFTSDAIDVEGSYMSNPEENAHTLTITVEIYHRVVDTVEADLDAIAVEVQTALGADCTFGGLAEIFQLADTALELTIDADAPHGVLTLTYTASYRVAANDPETIL